MLAIGSSKGSLLIVDIDLQFQQQQEQKSRQQKNKENSSISTTSTSSPSFFSSGKSDSSNLQLLATRRWAVTYQSSSFTAGQAISLLRWDNSSRLFIGDTTGKLFVLHDVEEMKYLMLHSAPKMLLHILPPPPVAGDYTSDASSSQEGFSSSANGNNTSNNSFPNSTIHQVDVAERQLLVSTTEPRVYLYSLDDEGRLFPLGGAKTAAAATGSSASSTLTITTTTSNGH